MKLRWLALFFAAFLLVSPMASADDGSSGSLEELVQQIVAWILGSPADPGGDPSGLGMVYPPGGQPQSITGGDPSEIGMNYPPSG